MCLTKFITISSEKSTVVSVLNNKPNLERNKRTCGNQMSSSKAQQTFVTGNSGVVCVLE